jgi:2,3-bisphosphoglycerate-dependent phosphoglycerate mutase
MELMILRHGQSMGDIEDRHEGRADFALSPLGHKQAQRAAHYLASHYPPDRIISSPLLRARDSAAYVAKALQMEVEHEEALEDWNNGILAGMLRSEALEKYPYPPQGRPYYEPLYGGESQLQLRARVEAFWGKLLQSDTRRVCLVTHAATINVLFRCLLNLPIDTTVHLQTREGAFHYWCITPKFRQVVFSNFQEHLRPPTPSEKPAV